MHYNKGHPTATTYCGGHYGLRKTPLVLVEDTASTSHLQVDLPARKWKIKSCRSISGISHQPVTLTASSQLSAPNSFWGLGFLPCVHVKVTQKPIVAVRPHPHFEPTFDGLHWEVLLER